MSELWKPPPGFEKATMVGMQQEIEACRLERDEAIRNVGEWATKAGRRQADADEWKRRANYLRSWMLGRGFGSFDDGDYCNEWEDFLKDFPEAAKWFEEEEKEEKWARNG